MTDEERARRLFDWVIKNIRPVTVSFIVMWVVLGVMAWGIATATRNGSDAASRTSRILLQNERDLKERSQRSLEDRARVESLVRSLYEAQQCTAIILLTAPELREREQIEQCFPSLPEPPPGFLPERPK